MQRTEETFDNNGVESTNLMLESENLQLNLMQQRKNSNIMNETKMTSHITLPILSFPKTEVSLIPKKPFRTATRNNLINMDKGVVDSVRETQMLDILKSSLNFRLSNFNKRISKFK